MKIVKSIIQDNTEIFENDLVTYTEGLDIEIQGRLSNICLEKGITQMLLRGFIIDKSSKYHSDTISISVKIHKPIFSALYVNTINYINTTNRICTSAGHKIRYKIYYYDEEKCRIPLPIGKKVNIILKSGKCITGILKDIEDSQCRYISIDISSKYESKIKKIKVKKIKMLYHLEEE